MVSSVNNDSTAMQELIAQLNQKMKTADTDGKAGLSKTELASVDTGSDAGAASFLKSLTAQFDSLDADKDGELSSNEISAVKQPTSSASNTSSTSTNTIETLLEKMMARIMQEVTTASSPAPTADTLTSALESAADTDGTAGLSKVELTAVNASNDTGKAFVKDLISNFDKIDTDANGQLSASEITASKPTVAASSINSDSLNELGNDLKTLSQSFVQNLLSTYKNGGLKAVASSLNISVNC